MAESLSLQNTGEQLTGVPLQRRSDSMPAPPPYFSYLPGNLRRLFTPMTKYIPCQKFQCFFLHVPPPLLKCVARSGGGDQLILCDALRDVGGIGDDLQRHRLELPHPRCRQPAPGTPVPCASIRLPLKHQNNRSCGVAHKKLNVLDCDVFWIRQRK